MEYLLLISLVIYLTYNAFALCIFKFPVSLSDTHYLFIGRNKKLNWIFTIMLWLVAFPILIFGLEYTPEQYKFILFITAAALMFVGAAPFFKDSKLEYTVHCVSAMTCSVSSILWGFLFGDFIVAIVSALLIGMFYISKDNVRVYLMETVLFISMYLQLYITFIM